AADEPSADIRAVASRARAVAGTDPATHVTDTASVNGEGAQGRDGAGADRLEPEDTNLSRQLDRANAHYRNGRLAEAEPLYLEVLRAQPDHFDALHLLGLIRYRQDRPLEALELIGLALRSNPRSASALSNHGAVLHRLERHEEALASYDRALVIQPDDAQAHYNRGVVLKDLRRLDEALTSYDRALAIRPDYPEALNHLGM